MLTGHPTASIIFPVKNEGINVSNTLKSLYSTKVQTSFEVIIINDQSTDNCCDFLKNSYLDKDIKLIETPSVGPANARNAGGAKGRGRILVFCDAHLEFEEAWLDRLVEPLLENRSDAVTPAIGAIGNPNFVGYGQTLFFNERSGKFRTHWNVKREDLFETAVLPGGCFAIKREVFKDAGGFETGFPTWGYEDTELSIKLWLFGYRCHTQPKAKVLHLFRKTMPFQVSLEEYYYNLLRMAYLHFSPERIKKLTDIIPEKLASDVKTSVLRNGAMAKRQQYLTKRKFDDSWFFRKFTIAF